MVINSKQAKAAIIVMILVLIFAVAFIALNFKEVRAAYLGDIIIGMGDGYDFSNKTIYKACMLSEKPDFCVNGWKRDPAYVTLEPRNGAKINYSGANWLNCLSENVSYVSSQKNFANKSWGCIKTNDSDINSRYYLIKIQDMKHFPAATNNTIKLSSQPCHDIDDDGYSRMGGVCGEWDCNDTNSTINPNATEVCDDNIDNDCDDDTDEEDSDCVISEICIDSDDDGYNVTGNGCGLIDCNDNNDTINPGAVDVCDSVDNDCNSATIDGSGEVTLCAKDKAICAGAVAQSCTDGEWLECTDADYLAHNSNYEAQESSCDQIDNNCDEVIDNIGGGESPEETQCGCYGGADPTAETCNLIDDDCDGKIDENWDADGDGFVDEDAEACEDVYGDYEYDCDDFNPNVNPGEPENCMNGIDDNCNGYKDDVEHDGCPSADTSGSGGSGGIYKMFTVGNGECEPGESYANACVDCLCPAGKTCVDNVCFLNSHVTAAPAKKIPPPTTPSITKQMTTKSLSLIGIMLVILFSAILAGTGSYFLYYKPRKELEEAYPVEQEIPLETPPETEKLY